MVDAEKCTLLLTFLAELHTRYLVLHDLPHVGATECQHRCLQPLMLHTHKLTDCDMVVRLKFKMHVEGFRNPTF